MDRPRRTIRQPVKAPQLVGPEPAPRVSKRKATPEVDPEKFIKTILESSKSDLVFLDMTDIINNNTWSMLSEESKAHLKTLLPRTAFKGFHAEELALDQMDVDDEKKDKSDAELNSSFFTDPHFLAAARTFQDHLYLNWFSEAHIAKVTKFKQGVVDGSLAAPWKDEVWERDNPIPVLDPSNNPTEPGSSFTCSSHLAGGATEIKLTTLAKNKIIGVGDVLAYRRSFVNSELVVEKDAMVESIHPKTFALTMVAVPGSTKDLPHSLLSDESTASPETVLSVTISGPSTLENALLDTDGRMPKSRRPNGNAWKSFSVWRWRPGAEYNPYDSRGGRENHGTLFYLRGSFFSGDLVGGRRA
ncbi:hypothetical protein CPC08DRAFT_727305 [Agrocybe pediades]|nr:hypothetical protein CPC08DRAFT_727305 [Agrocybe pediades]